MQIYEIWVEGHQATGDSSSATCLGHAAGSTFRQACQNLANVDKDFKKFFDPKRMTY